MFSIVRTAPNRLEIQLDGKLDVDDMNAALDAMIAETEGLENGQMLFCMGEFTLPTFAAIKVEFARLPSMIGFIRKFSRCALLADQGWLRAIAQLEGALIPGVEIKGFSRDERAAAEAWLESPESSESSES